MIVICTVCRAKFRIADEKVGPQGVRIRCTKCQNTFKVSRPESGGEPQRPAPPPPSPAAEAAPARPRSFDLDLDDPRRPRSVEPVFPTTPFPPPAPTTSAPDPFLAGGDSLASPAMVDPFAAAAATFDPSASSPHVDPFAPPPEPHSVSSASSAPDPFAEAALSLNEKSPSVPYHDDPFAMASALSPPSEGTERVHPPPLEFTLTDRLSRNELPASPVPVAKPPPLPMRTPVADSGEPPLGLAGLPESVGVATAQPPAAAAEEKSDAARPPPIRWLRSLLVNSISMIVLLALALGFFMLWRGEGHGLKILQADPRAANAGGGLVATLISSGLYPTFDGRFLLFVRGEIRVEGPAERGSIRVRTDIVKDEIEVANAEGAAGAMPSPEELAGVTGVEGAERLRALLEQRAPKQVRGGERLPFLIVFTDYPSDLETVTFRVTAEATPAAGTN